MGWWNSSPEGASLQSKDNGHYWGDGPADIMDTAIEEIREQFRLSMGREPMLSELLAGLRFSASVFDELTPEGYSDAAADNTMMDRCNEIN
jgi:hypothetical protein